jgi:hypothetical protein
VSLDFFPTKQCFDVCQQKGNLLGLAVLYEKMKNGREAIKIYEKYLGQLDMGRFID